MASGQIVQDLHQAIREIESERDEELTQVRARYQARIDTVRRTIAIFTGETVFTGEDAQMDGRPNVPSSLSVGAEKIEIVRAFLQKHPEGVRQADVHKATGLNRGSVSVALRVLCLRKEIEQGKKLDGSTVWSPIKVPASKAA